MKNKWKIAGIAMLGVVIIAFCQLKIGRAHV